MCVFVECGGGEGSSVECNVRDVRDVLEYVGMLRVFKINI